MKAEMKAVVASLVVIVLALSAVSGITYSWFSDEETAKITVETGKIEIKDLSLEVTLDNGVTTTPIGTYTATNGVVEISVSSALSDNDSIVVKVSNFTINHTIAINYYETYTISGPNPEFFTASNIQETAVQYQVTKNKSTAITHDDSIVFTFNSDGKGMDQHYDITLTFNATQINKPIESIVAVGTEASELSIATGTADSNGTVKVSIPANNDRAASTAVLAETTAKTVDSYTTVSTLNVVSGIELTGTDTSGKKIDSYLSGQKVTLTFVLDGKYCDTDGNLLTGVAIYHEDNEFKADESKGESTTAIYDNGKTTITVVTTQGFSPYFVTTGVAKIGDAYYPTLIDAFKAVEENGEILLVSDSIGSGIGVFSASDGFVLTTKNSGIRVNNNITLDFGGHTYTVGIPAVGSETYETQAFHLEKGYKLTMKNGTISSDGKTESDIKMLIQNYCNLTLENMVLDGSKLIYDSTGNYTLSNNNGTVIINNTEIIAKEGAVAFDVYGNFQTYTGPNVTVKGNSVIKGTIEFDVGSGSSSTVQTLSLESGTFTDAKLVIKGHISGASITKSDSVSIDTTGGTWTGNSITFA